MNTDVLHEAGKHPDWNESFYFNFYDKKSGICAFMRVGLKPNKNEKSMFCYAMMPDGSFLGKKSEDRLIDNSLAIYGLKLENLIPEKRWRLSFDGVLCYYPGDRDVPVSFDLLFDSLNEVFDYRGCVKGFKEEISRNVASEHLEQFGKIEGTLKIDGKSFVISGLGERDHSWGVRDWNAPKMWIWDTAQFSEELALNLTKLIVAEGEVDAGFVHIGGENIPLMKADVKTDYDRKGRPVSFKMLLTDIKGNYHRVTGKVVHTVTLPFASPDGNSISVMHETLTKYSYNKKIGYGIAEYLIKKK
ncbi:MAG: DUF7065 domain-containing protein [Candidatus Methanofastidiosia archaeon]